MYIRLCFSLSVQHFCPFSFESLSLNATYIIAQRVYIWSPCYSIGLYSRWCSYHHSCTESPRRFPILISSRITSVSFTSLHVKNLLICTEHPLCSPSFLLAHAVCALVILFFVHSFFSVATSNQILVLQTSLCAFSTFSNHFILLPSVISYHPDLFCLTETWIKPTTTFTELKHCTPPNYTFLSFPGTYSDISSLSSGGGTGCSAPSCYSLLICCHPFSTTYIFFF